MALSVVTIPLGTIQSKTIGSLNLQVVRFTSTKPSLVGDTIQVRLAPFGDKADADPTAQNQTTAYSAIMPSSPIVVSMNPMIGLDPTKHVYTVQLGYVTDSTFEITVRYMMMMDTRDFWDGTSTTNTFRFEKNVVNNTLTDDNTFPSVYNSEKQFKVEATHWDGTDAESAVFKQPFHSRFWCNIGGECCDLFAGCILTGNIENWAYQLYDTGGLLINGLSAFEDRTIKFQADFIAATTPSKYYIGVYRKDNATNAGNYWTDLTFSMAEFDPTMAAISSSPFVTDAFNAGGAAMTNLFGNIWEAEVSLDSTYFFPGATYRIFIVVEDSAGNEYSCITGDIVASGCPPVTIGAVVSNTYQYDSATTVYTADNLINVATRGRLKIEMVMDKTDYNANIIANGLAGDFDTNFQGFGTRVLDNFPDPATTYTNSSDIPAQFFDNTATSFGLRSIFEVPEDWTGQIKYIMFIWSFDITIGLLTYTDQLRKVVKLNVRENDELGANAFVPTIVDQDSNPLALDEICADTVSEITICFTEALPDDYDFVQITRGGTSGEYDENDEYTNTELTQLTDPTIQSADVDTAGGDGCMTINLDNLTLGQEYNIGGVFINKNTPAPPVCVNLAWDSTLLFFSETEFETRLTVNYDLTPLVDADVAQVSIQLNANGQGWLVFNYPNLAISPYPVNIYLPPGTPVAIVDYEIFITLTNGCQYLASFTDALHLLSPGNSNNTMLSLSPV